MFLGFWFLFYSFILNRFVIVQHFCQLQIYVNFSTFFKASMLYFFLIFIIFCRRVSKFC